MVNLLRIAAAILIFLGIYVALVKDANVGAAIFIVSMIFFVTTKPKKTRVFVNNPTSMYIKAANSRMGAKARMPMWDNLELESLNYLTFLSTRLDGGMLTVNQVHRCECGAPDHFILRPYAEEDENNSLIDNILGTLNHKSEPRSASQIRRVLSSMGVKESASEEATKMLANELRTGYRRHGTWINRARGILPPAQTETVATNGG